jgi:hypothetical protein
MAADAILMIVVLNVRCDNTVWTCAVQELKEDTTTSWMGADDVFSLIIM